MKRVSHNQGSDAWKLWRRGGIGGSDIAAIIGVSPYEDATRAAVVAAKVHGIERELTQAMYRGTILEPHARSLYQTRHRVSAPPACVEHDELPWARASLDGLCASVSAGTTERLEWLLELKCPGWETHDLVLAGIVAEHFLVQCQWQMFVTGVSRCDFVSFNPGERFTPRDWSLPWKTMLEVRKDGGTIPAPETWPRDWLAEVRLEADRDKQQWLLGEAAVFWLEVEELRAALARDARAMEAEFA